MSLKLWFKDCLIGELSLTNDEMLFSYASTWIKSQKSFELSFALPLREGSFGDKVSRSFFENLLTEGKMRGQLGQNHQIDERDEYSFLEKFGKDCAGALAVNEKPLDEADWSKVKISLEDIKQKVEGASSLYVDYESEEGVQFSLAGVQDKLPIIVEKDTFFIGKFGYPSTYILKPQIQVKEYKQTVLNEYICMHLASHCGLNVPNVELVEHAGMKFYIVERFDRAGLTRLHQQDFCQALGLTSKEKYEVRGGPSFSDVYKMVKEKSENKAHDLFAILDWLCFNLLIGNHDTHAKNISFLHINGKWELAPFYDLLSTAVYNGTTKNFAFQIGGQFDPMKLKRSNFLILEKDLEVREGVLVKRLLSMANKVEKNFDQSDEFISVKINNLIKKRINYFRQYLK